jgi:hypothetical protein
MLRRLLKPLWVLLALIFLLEAWLWDHLRPVVAALVDLLPWRPLKRAFAAAIERLPPGAAVVLFALPFLLLLPLKLAALWLFGRGEWLFAIGVLAVAKLIGLGFTAFIFDVTRPKLLQLAWFRWLYEHVLALRAWAHNLVDPIRQRALAWARALRAQRGGRFFRHLAALRRRMQRA